MANLREKGDFFEEKIANLLGIKRTAKSGAHWDNGDLACKGLIIEAKVKDTESWFRANKAEITKVIKQAEKHGVDWAYIQHNKAGDFVLLSLDTFVEMTEEWFKRNEKRT